MFESAAVAAILLVFAFTFWRPLRRIRTVLGVQHLLFTGQAFLVLGALVGIVLGEHSQTLVSDLGPVVAFVAGWIGFAAGMRFELRVLRTIPAAYFAVALMPAIVAATVVGLCSGTLLLQHGVVPERAWPSSLILAAAAASSGPTLVALLRGRRAGRSSRARPVLRLIEFSAGVDDVVVILLAIATFALFPVVAGPIPGVGLITIALCGAALLGLITWLFLGGKAREDERLLLGLAMLAFIAGFASWLRFSPAAVAAFAAVILVNLPGDRADQLSSAIRRVERPAVVILMTVIGIHSVGAVSWLLLLLVLLMTLGRLLAKEIAGATMASVQVTRIAGNRRWGGGLAPLGTLGLMVTLSYFQVWQDEVARTILTAVALSSIINELMAPRLLLGLLKRAEKRGLRADLAKGHNP